MVMEKIIKMTLDLNMSCGYSVVGVVLIVGSVMNEQGNYLLKIDAQLLVILKL
jgi:hypothetical protein